MSNSKYAIPDEEVRALKIHYLSSKLSDSSGLRFESMDNEELDLMITIAGVSKDERDEIVDEINIATGKITREISSNPTMNRSSSSATCADSDVLGEESIDQYMQQSESEDDRDDYDTAVDDGDSNEGEIFEEEVVDKDFVANTDNDDPYNFEGNNNFIIV